MLQYCCNDSGEVGCSGAVKVEWDIVVQLRSVVCRCVAMCIIVRGNVHHRACHCASSCVCQCASLYHCGEVEAAAAGQSSSVLVQFRLTCHWTKTWCCKSQQVSELLRRWTP
jgi:hypothetical protein